MQVAIPIKPADIDLYDIPMSDQQFTDWVISAHYRSVLPYYRGHVAKDRLETFSPLRESMRQRLNQVARAAFGAWEQGLVDLVQRRMAPGEAIYFAVRSKTFYSARRPLVAYG